MGWRFVLSLIFAMIVALFAIQNAESVAINFVTWNVTVSQALVILLSAIVGAVIVMLLSLFKQIKMGSEIKYEKRNVTGLQAENTALRAKLDQANEKLVELAATAKAAATAPITDSDTAARSMEAESQSNEQEPVQPKSWAER
ncbi:MAG: hypothetical protein CVU86_08650 [Firmicutes bacterium HGW-Firmicutes-11]|nr:MAG: hypothetical protein CVU86_08650 [Firmicutes bacterium HGW-Firmicutes-11]